MDGEEREGDTYNVLNVNHEIVEVNERELCF
jgi:hypothetical protein